MASVYAEKPKNGRRQFQWWLLIIGFWIGAFAGAAYMSGRVQPTTIYTSSENTGDLALTATAIIQGATQTAGALLIAPPASQSDPEMDAMMMTATAVIAEATRQAPGGG